MTTLVMAPSSKEFIDWYKASYQDNNVSETKEMAVDFRNHPSVSPTVVFNDQAE